MAESHPRLTLAYIGTSTALERLLTPRTAAKQYPELFRELLVEMHKLEDRQLSLWNEEQNDRQK